MSGKETAGREADDARLLRILRLVVVLTPFVFLLVLLGGALIHRAFGGGLRLPGGDTAGSFASVLILTFGLNGEALRTPAAFTAGARLLAASAALLVATYAALCALFGGTLGDFFGFTFICAAMTLLGWGMAIVRRKLGA